MTVLRMREQYSPGRWSVGYFTFIENVLTVYKYERADLQCFRYRQVGPEAMMSTLRFSKKIKIKI